MQETRDYTVVSTFAGCGGSSLGYRMAGFRELLAIDNDGNSVETFKLNFPEVPVWNRDICGITGKEILDFLGIGKGDLDLLDGSPPCQGFSTAGNRNIADERNNLFLEFVRLVRELRPKVFVMENVSGQVKGNMKGKFVEIMEAFGSLDYSVRAKLLNSKYYGVPQSRERIFYIGVRKDVGIEPIYPIPNNKLVTVLDAIGDLEEIEIPNRKDITVGLKEYAVLLDEGESASKYHPKGSLFRLIRLARNRPSPTVIRSASTGLLHYKYNLSFLSAKEVVRLCSFPDSFSFVGSRNDVIDRVGNAVMPLQMKAIAETIRDKVLSPYYGRVDKEAGK